KIEVKKADGILNFKGLDGFDFFDQVVINNNKYTLNIDTGVAAFKGQVMEDSSVYGNYIGYKWFYEKGDIRGYRSNEASEYLSIEIIFSKTVPDGRILVNVKALLIEKLAKVYDVTVAGYLSPQSN